MCAKKAGNITFGQLLGLILLLTVIIFTVGYFIAREQLAEHDIDLAAAGGKIRSVLREAKTAGEDAVADTVEEIDVDVNEVLPESSDFSGANAEAAEFSID